MTAKHFLWSAALCVLACPARATVREVPGQYPTIQAAVDAAVDGDLVRVQPGSYDGFFLADKSISLLSAGLDARFNVGEVYVQSRQRKARLDASGVVFIGGYRGNGVTLDGYDGMDASATFFDCEFNGGLACFAASADVESCRFVDGGIQSETDGYSDLPIYLNVSYCEFIRGGIGRMPIPGRNDLYVSYSTFHSSGIYSSGDPEGWTYVFECRFDQGSGVYLDSNVFSRNAPARPAGIWNCRFDQSGLWASSWEGAEIAGSSFTHDSYLRFSEYCRDCTANGCIFEDNGTAILLTGQPEYIRIINCLLNRNVVGIDADNMTYGLSVENCTITNSALEGIRCAGDASITNSIVYRNGRDHTTYYPKDIHVPVWGSANVSNSDIGTWFVAQEGWIDLVACIRSDPRFANAKTDLRLSSLSPCIDTGGGHVNGSDLLGRPRTVGARVDMGAYEWPGPGLRVESMTPDSCYAGAAPVLQIAGSGLAPSCYLYFNGTPHAMTRHSEYLATAALTAAETQIPGTYEVYVVNPGGETSSRHTFTVTRPVLRYLSLFPPDATGGNLATATLGLTGQAPAAGVTVQLASSDPALASVPATVTVPAGAKSITFKFPTTAVATGATAAISAWTNAADIKTQTLTLVPPVLRSLSLSPSTVKGGKNSDATVTLTGPAPKGGITLPIQSSNPAVAQVPSSVTVPANARTVTFRVSTSVMGATTAVTITVGDHGKTLTVIP